MMQDNPELTAKSTTDGGDSRVRGRKDFLDKAEVLLQKLPESEKERLWLATMHLPVLQYLRASLGWEVADDCLEEVIRTLLGELPHIRLIGRMDGPDLVLLAVVPEGEPIREEYQSPGFLGQVFHVNDRSMFLSLRAGLAWHESGDNAVGLMKKAATALNRAGTGLYGDLVVWKQAMKQETEEAATIAVDLPAALENGELELVYQPKFRIADERVCGVEALLRWPPHTSGGIEVSRIIRIAELTEFIIPLGRWVLDEACRQAARWQDEGIETLRIAVNVSAMQLIKSEIQEDIRRAMERAGIGPEWLEIELTENALMVHGQHAPRFLQRVHELGIPVAIDDFGTGYSSLAYMKHFPIQRLKIDRCFIQGLMDDPMDGAIVNCVVAIGKNMGFKVVAEGVETADQLEKLREAGCHEVQGYYLSRPLPAADIPAFLQEHL